MMMLRAAAAALRLAAVAASVSPPWIAPFAASFVPGSRRPNLPQNLASRAANVLRTSLELGDADIAAEDGVAVGGVGAGRDMKALQDWAASRGFALADGVELASGDGENWGVSLRKSAEAGTPIMRVPKSLILSSSSFASDDVAGADAAAARAVLGDMGAEDHWPEFLLAARILRERARGEESDWRPWIESLPRTFATGVFMDELERSRLPAMAAGLVELQDRQLEAFGRALRLLTDEDVRRVLSGPDADDVARWAFSVVFTRSHRYEAQANGGDDDDGGGVDVRTEIVPMGDIFNHREPGDVLWNPDADGAGQFAEFVLREDMTLGPDEDRRDVHLSYGMSIPHRFLAVFGFVDESTPEVLSQVIFTDPTPELIELGCNDPKRMVFRSDGMIANAVWDCLLYAILSSEPEEQRALYEAHVRGDREAKAEVHSRHALEVSMALKKHVEGTLDSFPEECTESLEEHPILPLINRNNALMRTVFGRVKERLDGIVENEFRRRMAECGRKETG